MSKTQQDYIVKALHNEWTENILNLVEQSYGLSFKPLKNNPSKIMFSFFDDSSNWAWAQTSGSGQNLFLQVNTTKLSGLDTDSKSGNTSTWEESWDGLFAHEFTHLVMQANIADIWSLPSYFIEGSAELTVGGDTRESTIIDLLMSSRSKLNSVYSGSSGDYYDNYGGGYMLLRYYAKQSAKHTGRNQVAVMHDLMSYLAENGGSSYDSAISSASNGFFSGEADLIKTFTDAVNAADITTYEDARSFIKDVAGIDFTNSDTGAITGKDAGGSVSKSYESIVPEYSSPSSWKSPTSDYTSTGMRLVWPVEYYFQNISGISVIGDSVTVGSSYTGNLDFSDFSAIVNFGRFRLF